MLDSFTVGIGGDAQTEAAQRRFLTAGLQKQTHEGIKQIGVNFDPALAFRHTQAVEDKPVEILTFQNHRDRVAVIRIVLIDPAAAAA